MPRVTVVVSHYNRQQLLSEALDSIAAQSFRDLEVVVVNDHGADSEEIVRTFAGRIAPTPVRYEYRPSNRGVAATRNRGTELARGELVAYLDDDDLWRPDHLVRLVSLLDAEPDRALAYGDAEILRFAPGAPGADPTAGAQRIEGRRVLAVPFALEKLKQDDFIVPGGMVHRRSLFDVVGPFDETLYVSDDWDWLLRVAAHAGPQAFVRLPRIVVTVRLFGEGVNLSAGAGKMRLAALKVIERRHKTPPLEPKTFWEVAEVYKAEETSSD